MSRSGYVDGCENIELYRANVRRSIGGRRGQKFLRELAAAMDSMPEKVLISDELIDDDGRCCTIGVICKSRGLDVSGIDKECPQTVANLVAISRPLAAEIEFENDEIDLWLNVSETPGQRWERMRKWVDANIINEPPTVAT